MTSQSNCAVQVKIELGHRATVKKNPSPEGFTHDWTVYVRGPEGCDISHFIEKVVFNLHVSFENPKREHYKPPYAVSESGYAGFELPIDIYFKNKEEPKKLRFTYDLFLKLEDSPPVNHIRCEKLTFQNPTEEFKKKLLKAGGVPVTPHGEPTTFGQFTELFGPPITADVKKKPKQHIPSKEKSSRDHSGSSSSSSTKSFSNKHGSSTSSSHKSQRPSSKDVISKDISAKDAFSKDISAKDAFSKEHKSKEHKSHSDEKKEKKASKEPSKRSLDVVPQDTSLPKKPKQRSSSVSSNSDIKVKEKHDISEKQSDRHKHLKEKDLLKAKSNSPSIGSVRSDHEKRDKHKSKSKSESKTDKSKLEKKVDSGREFKSDNIVNSEERKKKEEKKFDSSASVQKVDMKEKYKSHVESKSKDFPSRSHQKSFDIEHIGKRSSTSTPENKQNLKRQKIEDSDVSSSEESSDSSDEEHEEIVKNIIQNLDSDEDNQDEEGSHQSEDNNEDLDVSPDRSSVSNYDYKPVLMHQSKSALDRLMNEFSDDEDDDDDMDHNLPPLSSPLIQKPSPSSSMRSFKGSPASHKSSTSSSSKPSKTSQYSPSSQKSSSSTREHHSSHKTSKSSSKSEKDKIKHSKVVSSKDAVLKEVEFSQKETSDSKKNYGKFREQSITAVEDWTKDKTNEPCTKSEEYKKDTKKYRKSSKERDSNDKVEEKHLKENKTKSKTKPEKIKKEMKDKKDMNPSVKSEEKDNREETKVEIGHGKMKENIKKEKKGYEAEVKTPEFPSSYLKDEPDLTKEFLTINGIDKAEEKEEFEYGDLGKAPNGEDLCTLISLYQKLESTQDGILLQKIIQEIQKTGLYKINESCETFDFDLCELDSSTVEVLKNYLCAV